MTEFVPAAAESPLLVTPLHAAHRAAGGRLVPFAGWHMPVQYVGVLPEVKAVRESVGLFDVSHMGRLRVHGPGAFDFLQYVSVNDVAALPEAGGMAQYSLLCREAGGIIDDIIIYRLGLREFVVVVNASNHDKDFAWLTGHAFNFDMVLEDETERTALIAVQGPNAVALVDDLADRDLTILPRFGVDESAVAGLPCMIARTGYTGEDGFELFTPKDCAARLWAALVAAGGVPCGLGARDTLRLESALPLYGHEMDEHVSPFEARLSWVVKCEKDADFLGKAALTELKAAPKSRSLIGIELDGRGIPRDGYAIVDADGEPVGHVTSGTFSPMRGKGVAMASVLPRVAKSGTALHVVIRDAKHAAHVVKLPFYKNV